MKPFSAQTASNGPQNPKSAPCGGRWPAAGRLGSHIMLGHSSEHVTPCQPSCSPIHPPLSLPFITHSSPLSPSSSPLLALCAYACLPSPPCFSCLIQSYSITVYSHSPTHPLTHLHISHQSTSQLSALTLLPPHSPFVSCTQ